MTTKTQLKLSEAALSSPGRALSERSRWENRVTQAVDRHMVKYLNGVSRNIMSNNEVSSHYVHEAYGSAVSDILDSFETNPGTEQVLADHLNHSTFPDMVFDTAEYLFSEGQQQKLSRSKLQGVLEAGLDYDQPSFADDDEPLNFLEASAAPRIIGQVLARTIGRGKRWSFHTRDTARTASTNALNEAQNRYLQRSSFTHKQWVTRRDDIVRDSHADADGQTVPKASLFQVGAASLSYPGQGTYPPEETFNCRCVMIAVNADGQSR